MRGHGLRGAPSLSTLSRKLRAQPSHDLFHFSVAQLTPERRHQSGAFGNSLSNSLVGQLGNALCEIRSPQGPACVAVVAMKTIYIGPDLTVKEALRWRSDLGLWDLCPTASHCPAKKRRDSERAYNRAGSGASRTSLISTFHFAAIPRKERSGETNRRQAVAADQIAQTERPSAITAGASDRSELNFEVPQLHTNDRGNPCFRGPSVLAQLHLL